MTDSPAPESPTSMPPQPPPARAFAQGTGVLLQTAGMILFLSTCCVCSLAGSWDPTLSRSEVLDQLQSNQPIGVTVSDLLDQPAKAGLMLIVMFMTLGGLALAGFGLGMQSEKPRSALAALITTGLMVIVLTLAGVGLWVGQASWVARVWHAVLMIGMLILMGFTWAAFQQFRNTPPTPLPVDEPL